MSSRTVHRGHSHDMRVKYYKNIKRLYPIARFVKVVQYV